MKKQVFFIFFHTKKRIAGGPTRPITSDPGNYLTERRWRPSFSYAEERERERGPRRIEREAWRAGIFLNLRPGWNNMGKQDFSCQKWLEQGGGGERERA